MLNGRFNLNKLLLVAVTLVTILFSSKAHSESGALEFAKSRQRAIFYSCHSSAKEIDRTLNYHAMVVNALQSNWESLNQEQKDIVEYSLTKIIRTSLQKRFRKYSSKNIKWEGSEARTESVSVVRSVITVTTPVEEKFEIDYVVLKENFTYKVIDIIFDGVSTVENYRHQFSKIIRTKGTAALIDRLKEKAAESEIDPDDGC